MLRTSRVIVLGLFAAALAACRAEAPEPAPTEAADATPQNAPGIALGDARVQLPVVPGRPGVAYFTVSQANGAPRKLVAVHVEGAGRSEIHQSMQEGGMSTMKPVAEIAVGPGRTVKFEPGGYHVMLFDVDATLTAGKPAELTVTFDNGDKASVAATVGTVAAGAEHAH
jgi:copper(I)-binding protein